MPASSTVTVSGPEADIAVLRARFPARVARRRSFTPPRHCPGLFAEGVPVVLEHVAPELAPLANPAADDDGLDLSGLIVRGDWCRPGRRLPSLYMMIAYGILSPVSAL